MTCIVGLKANGRVFIGGDSAGSDNHNIETRLDTKVFKVGDFLIGYTSSFRMGQLLRFKFSPPAQHKGQDDYEYLCTEVIDHIKTLFESNGFSKVDSNVHSGGVFLLAYNNRLYSIYDDYQVGETANGFAACGCGDQVALGSLYTTLPRQVVRDGVLANITMTAESRINMALSAAEEFCLGVRKPFVILSSEETPK